MLEKIRKILLKAEYNGFLHFSENSWKEDTDELITPDVITQIYTLLYLEGFIPSFNKDFIFLSPSSHIPTNEEQIFELDATQRRRKGLFIVTDLRHISFPTPALKKNNSHFAMLQANVNRLPFLSNSVDMIWDRKGGIWHSYNFWYPFSVYKLLSKYHRLLKPGGVVVLDALEGRPTLRVRSISDVIRILQLSEIRPSDLFEATEQYESSSAEVFDHLPKKEQRKIKKYFTQKIIGEKKTRVMVLQKRQ